jgi:hypothetical protein
MFGGHAVGIIVLNVGYPLIPGNVANATTFPFPVRYEIVEGADIPSLLAGDPSLLGPSLAAAQKLVRDGCRAIVGACGYFARFQSAISGELEVPVFMSSLLQVPLILRALRQDERLGILCASAASLDAATLGQVGVSPNDAITIRGLESSNEFRTAILEGKGWMDDALVEEEVVGAATQLCDDHPEVGAILLECSDMPPYAVAVQRATGRPVWDFITLIEWINAAVVRRDFSGFI